MADNSDRNDPWAPPEQRTAPQDPAGPFPGTPQGPEGTGPVNLGKRPEATPPSQQPTVTSMPAAGFGAPQGPGDVPPPPVAPGGPAQPAPGPYGYPAAPAAGQPGTGYGYPGPAGYPDTSGYPAPYGPGGWGAPAQPNNGLGIASMVLGIIAVVTCWAWGLGVVLGVLALIFGIIGQRRAKRGEATNGGMAVAGIATGAVGIVLGLAAVVGLIVTAMKADELGSRYDSEESYGVVLVLEERTR
ncbi:DUF4190 domain-containing protein [Streptomyces sp. MUM 203J]|uniref:DUF4190 domain-containing protein n=1 Tax=Streptomyces sp. MUM 203J TaxID=2791990 RepID=UPI001F03A6B0|nr:DUF4190 domain-containing protein [Streptomyces sp. MUM 203J]MCH0542542.1 DUF4190 domain-containing protein [Streptomyces sp. MUM 203J]